jgi:polyisoprenoid-binding protein YceI
MMIAPLLVSIVALQSPPSFGFARYEVDARTSTVGFDATSTLHDFTGTTHAISADLRADSDDPARLAGGAVWIEARTLDTGNGSRDDDMRDLLDVKDHPQIVFRLDSISGRLEAGRGDLTARGRFTIKGVEKARVVHFRFEPLPTPDGRITLHARGEVRFNMSEHGIKRPSILISKVGDEVRVWFDLTLRPMADEGVEATVRTLQIEEELVPNAKGSVARKRSDTESVWTAGDRRLWTRKLEPVWVEEDGHGVSTIDPRTGTSQASDALSKGLMDRLSQPIEAGSTWSASADEPDGRRTLRVTFGAQVPARAPAWAFDRHAWANGPATTPVR